MCQILCGLRGLRTHGRLQLGCGIAIRHLERVALAVFLFYGDVFGVSSLRDWPLRCRCYRYRPSPRNKRAGGVSACSSTPRRGLHPCRRISTACAAAAARGLPASHTAKARRVLVRTVPSIRIIGAIVVSAGKEILHAVPQVLGPGDFIAEPVKESLQPIPDCLCAFFQRFPGFAKSSPSQAIQDAVKVKCWRCCRKT